MSLRIIISPALLCAAALAACSPSAPPQTVFPTATIVTRAPAATPTPFPATSVPATSAPRATTAATTAATVTVALPTASAPGAGPRIIVQAPGNSIVQVDTDGNPSLLAKLNVSLDAGTLNPGTNAISATVFGTLPGAGLIAIDAAGVRPTQVARPPLSGFAVGGPLGAAKVAWATISQGKPTSELFIADPESAQAKSILQDTATGELRALRPFAWSADGKRLFYSREPMGLGGYILFGGISNLAQYTLSDGKTKELVRDKQFGSLVCMDSLAPNERYLAYHCGDKQIGIFDLTNGKSSAVTPPTQIQFAALGTARFNPDSSRVAYAAARRNPDDEQGWVLVSEGLGGASKLVATSPAKDYFEVVIWLTPNLLLLQSHGAGPAIWTVRADGSNLRRLADGTYLGVTGLK